MRGWLLLYTVVCAEGVVAVSDDAVRLDKFWVKGGRISHKVILRYSLGPGGFFKHSWSVAFV